MQSNLMIRNINHKEEEIILRNSISINEIKIPAIYINVMCSISNETHGFIRNFHYIAVRKVLVTIELEFIIKIRSLLV